MMREYLFQVVKDGAAVSEMTGQTPYEPDHELHKQILAIAHNLGQPNTEVLMTVTETFIPAYGTFVGQHTIDFVIETRQNGGVPPPV